FFDVSAFLSAFNAQDPIADFDRNDAWDFFDVSAFLSSYNAGCP
ncbi:MAG: GC-type dockerin domain-anchored protein, partial [Phycisphaerales bacterium]